MSPLLLVALLAAPAATFTPAALWEAWPGARFVRTPAPCLRHADVVEALKALERRHPGGVALEELGRSIEGRTVHLLRIGTGPRKLLLWSQMHGDEPSATPALFDVADLLLSRSEDPEARAILDGFTLLMIPMLNPDGAERYERRNAQGIDVNRDALNLATPEGRLLKTVRDRHQPELGLNLHDQDRRATVGSTGALATISLLAVAGDARGTVTPGRERARRVCASLISALSPLIPGGVGRYDEDWSPRAFGDNLTAWGTPVVLIESGGVPAGRPLTDLTRLNFVAIGSTLHELAKDDARSHDVTAYESLPRNGRDAYSDFVLRGGRMLQPGVSDPFRADLAFDRLRGDQAEAGCGEGSRSGSRITEVGDARFVAAGRSDDVTGALITPAFVVSVRGGKATEWLSAATLEALGRLGVGRIRWHVTGAERPAAEALAQARRAAHAPALAVIEAEAPPAKIEITGPPSPGAARTLAHVVIALRGGLTDPSDAKLTALDWLRDLGGPLDRQPRGGSLGVGGPASLVVLRVMDPRDARPEEVVLEAIFLDGQEIPLGR